MDGSGAQPQAAPQTTPKRAGDFGVHSEVGKLRKVMVHRPELSLQRLTPSNHDDLLFDDVLWVERAQYEHDQFVARMRERGVEVFLVLDNGPCHTSKTSLAALAARAVWLHVIWLARYSPELSKKEREWRYLKRDARGHLARDLRSFADAILDGLRRLGGTRLDIVDQVPNWFLEGHRKPPTGRPPGRPNGAKDSYKRSYHRRNLPAPT